jgi:hypothetical protein
LKDGWELEAIDPEKKEREERNDTSHPEAEGTLVKKDVKQHDVHDHRPEQGEAQRDESGP